jgi:hypothetical protein
MVNTISHVSIVGTVVHRKVFQVDLTDNGGEVIISKHHL